MIIFSWPGIILNCFWISFWTSISSTLILFFSPISFKIKPNLILFFAFFSNEDLFFCISFSSCPWLNILISSSISAWGKSSTLILSSSFNIWFLDIKFREFLNSVFICSDNFFFKSFKSWAPRVLANSSFTSTALRFLTNFILQLNIACFPDNSFFGKFSGNLTITLTSSSFFDFKSCLSKFLINKSLPSSSCMSFASLPSKSLPSTVAL